ncbi:MAG: hypothetical protein Q4A25_03325 [Candidatus Saccharibacteria bacterium]|nr:hypothetical protein [Candidatus Saccharibacteria bacterium]
MKKSILFASWLGLVTAPSLVRKFIVDKNQFTGNIQLLSYSGNSDIGYYFFPGILYPPEDIIRNFINPQRYDLHLVNYEHRDYDPISAAKAVARHIRGSGYRKVRIISVSMGDQLLRPLGIELQDYVKDDRIEIVSIDSLPNPDFISRGYKTALVVASPILMTLRILGGWVAEIPCFRRDGCWRSPAEVIEQLGNLLKYGYDYTEDPIRNCVKAVIRDEHVFYAPEYAKGLFEDTFDDYEYEPLVHFNAGCDLANIRDKKTVEGYRQIFDDIDWKF